MEPTRGWELRPRASSAKTFAAALVRWSGLPWLIRETWARRKASILLYHHPSPDDFRDQLRFLARRYTFITLDQLLDAIEAQDRAAIPPKGLVISFDDGHRQTLELAAICHEFGVVPTIYLCSGVVGTNRHFWWEEVGEEREAWKRCTSTTLQLLLEERCGFTFTREYPSRQALSRREVERMSSFVSFQSHSRFHRILPLSTAAERVDEIVRSKHEVEQLTGLPCRHFSYPNGDYDEQDVELVKGAGYRSARTAEPGWNDLRTDPFRLKIAGAPETGSANVAAASFMFLFLRSLLDRRKPPVPLGDPRFRKPHVVVTEVETRGALATCRSLARGSYDVAGVAVARPAAGHWSRSCSRRFTVVDPRVNAERFVDELAAIVGGGGYDALIPGSDASLLAISSRRAMLEDRVRLGLPPETIVERVLDKRALLDVADSVGLAPPTTRVCSTRASGRTAAEGLGYPVLLKPAASVTPEGPGMRERATALAADDAALDRLVADVGTPFLVQQSETGTLCSVAGVIAGGRLLATAASRYRRTWPVASGAASFSETMTPPAGLVERVEALMSGLGWEGIFEVELIHRADGSFAAIDVNPRVYGSLALATVAGAPLPVVWCEWLLGRNGAPVSARPGIRYRREDADLSHALWRLRHGDFAAGVAALAPHRRVTHAYGQLGDPGPLVAQLAGIARRRLVKV